MSKLKHTSYKVRRTVVRRCSVSLPTSLALQANHQFDKLMASHQTRAFGHPPPEGLLHPVFPWAE